MNHNHRFYTFLAVLGTINLLSITGALIVVFADFQSEDTLVKVVAALAFVGNAVTGLIGVVGSLRTQQGPEK